MYRKYLHWLEEKMPKLSGAPEKIVYFHSYRHNWFENYVQDGASYIAILLVFLIYSGLVLAVLGRIGDIKYIWILLIIYLVAFILSISAAIILIKIIRPPLERIKGQKNP